MGKHAHTKIFNIETDEFDPIGVKTIKTFLWGQKDISPYLGHETFIADPSN